MSVIVQVVYKKYILDNTRDSYYFSSRMSAKIIALPSVFLDVVTCPCLVAAWSQGGSLHGDPIPLASDNILK